MQPSCNSGHKKQERELNFQISSAHLGILLTLPWFMFLEMTTGIGSNSSLLPLSPHDIRKVESVVKK